MKCYVSISHTFWILIHSIGMLLFPLLLVFLARIKKVFALEGIIYMLTKTPIDAFNDKSYRQVSRHDLSVISVLVERQ